MTNWRALEGAVVGLVLSALVLTGLLVGPGGGAHTSPTRVGDGNATVVVDENPEDRLHIDAGRFGTGGFYLRIPDVTVRVSDVRGAPRLVYRIEVPSLEVDVLSTRVLGPATTGPVTVRSPDRGLDPGLVDRDAYTATVTVRVQSFEVDQTVYNATGTVTVQR